MMPSASAVEDAFDCAYQFRDDVERLPDTTNEASATGVLTHAMIEAHLNGVCDEPVVALANVDRARVIFARWVEWWDERPESRLSWQTEVPYAISLTTGAARVLPSEGQRDYSAATPDEVPGTIDLLAFDGDVAFVWDVKTTKRPEFTTEAPLNSQLLTLSLAVHRAHDVAEVQAGLLFANEYTARLEPAAFDALTLDMFEDELRRKVASIPTSSPNPGKHCRFCPARIACPEVPKAFRVKRAQAAHP